MNYQSSWNVNKVSKLKLYDFLSHFIEFLTREVVTDDKEVRQSTVSSDLLTDKVTQVTLELQHKQNSTTDDEQSPTTPLGWSMDYYYAYTLQLTCVCATSKWNSFQCYG